MKIKFRQGTPFLVVFSVWLVGVLLTLGFWAAVIYVAWHFISKYW